MFCILLQKNILCQRMLHSLRFFTFFAKECCILYVLFHSLEKNGKEQNCYGFVCVNNRDIIFIHIVIIFNPCMCSLENL